MLYLRNIVDKWWEQLDFCPKGLQEFHPADEHRLGEDSDANINSMMIIMNVQNPAETNATREISGRPAAL